MLLQSVVGKNYLLLTTGIFKTFEMRKELIF